MSVIPPGDRVGDCGQIFPDNEQMGLASASVVEANRGWSSPDEGLESKGVYRNWSLVGFE